MISKEPQPGTEPHLMTPTTSPPPDNPQPIITLLTLPLEIRLEIYTYLFLLPAYTPHQDTDLVHARVHPALLATCSQIHAEAAPLLYAANSWQAHYALLAALPRLRACHRPVIAARPRAAMRRWRLRVRLDVLCPFTTDAAAEAFSGADEVELEVRQATFWGGAGVEALGALHGVRGVRRVRVFGSTAGFGGYLHWLAGSMTAPVGAEVGEYVATDETERKRLCGWS